MNTVAVTERAARGTGSYTALHVVPEIAPEQARLSEGERDVAWARRHGAEWVPGAGHMRVGDYASPAEARALEARFATVEARERAARSLARLTPPVDRMTMARAALAEVRRAGLEPMRRLPERDIPAAARRYVFTVNDPESPFAARAFDAAAREAGLVVHFDLDRSSPNFGMRYLPAAAPVPATLARFFTGEARVAAAAQMVRAVESRALLADAANTVAGGRSALRRPLALPRAASEPEGYSADRAMLERLTPTRRARWIEITRNSLAMKGAVPVRVEAQQRALAAAAGIESPPGKTEPAPRKEPRSETPRSRAALEQ